MFFFSLLLNYKISQKNSLQNSLPLNQQLVRLFTIRVRIQITFEIFFFIYSLSLSQRDVNCSRTEFWMMKNMPNAMPFISKSGIHYSWETVLEYFSHELWPPVIVAAAVFLFPSLFVVRWVDIVTIRLGPSTFIPCSTHCIALQSMCFIYVLY